MRAIVFDVDDTIYDQQQPFRNAVERVIPNVACSDMDELYKRFRFHSDENFPKVMNGSTTLVAFRNHRTIQSLIDLGYPAISEEQALYFQEVYEEELDNIVMHEEVRKTLDILAANNIPMGIITNGPTDHQYKKVIQLGLLNWIEADHVIISQATGFQKPEKEIFQLAEKQFGFDPSETLYVGDNFDNDVVGSKSAGWQALWFNHRHRELAEDVAVIEDIELTEFCQLPDCIAEVFELSPVHH